MSHMIWATHNGPCLKFFSAKLIVTSVVWSNTCLLNISVKKQVEKNIILILRLWWWPTKFPMKKLQGRFLFDHFICFLSYGRHHMVHMIWSIYIYITDHTIWSLRFNLKRLKCIKGFHSRRNTCKCNVVYSGRSWNYRFNLTIFLVLDLYEPWCSRSDLRRNQAERKIQLWKYQRFQGKI